MAFPTNDIVFERIQAGIESVPGTAVAATRIVYARGVMSYERELRWGASSSGTRFGRRTPSYAPPNIGIAVEQDGTFEDLPWWFKLGLKGGVTGVGDAGAPIAYTYTFTPTGNLIDLNALTAEIGEPGLVYEIDQVMLDEMTIAINPLEEGAWLFSGNCLGRTVAPSSYTGAIAERTVEAIPAPGTKLYIDSATIGTTQVLNKFLSAELRVTNNLHFKRFGENATNFAPEKVGIGEFEVECDLTLEWDADGEFANYRATTPVERFVRLESEGTVIHDAVKKRVRLDMNGYWSAWEANDNEGNKVQMLTLQPGYNTTSAYMLSAAVVNALATLA